MSLQQKLILLQRQIDELKVAVKNGDPRLTDARTPTAHASTHYDAGTDPVDITQLDGYPGGGTTFLRDDGTWATPGGGAGGAASIGITVDGAASVLTTGVKGFVSVPFNCTINSVTVLSTDPAVTSGSIVFDIWKDTYANFPPTVADTITAAAKPTISGATKSTDATLTGWTTTITAGDVLGFKIDSVATFTRVTLILKVTKT